MSVEPKVGKLRRAARTARNVVPILLLRRLDRPPIIIGGCARSGTTLLLSTLSSHPRIFAFPNETGLFCPTAYRRKGTVALDAPFSRVEFYRHLLWQKIPRSAHRWCEKTPKNVHFFGRILDHFEGRVRIIHVVRDGRDVVTSRHPTDPSRYWVTPRRWVDDTSAGLAWEGHPSVLTMRYEDLVGDLEAHLVRLGAFLDEDLRGLAGVWHERAAIRESRAWFHDVRPAHSGSVERWREPGHRAPVEELMAMPEAVRLLDRLGYETTNARRNTRP
jgi:hypothetical protein